MMCKCLNCGSSNLRHCREVIYTERRNITKEGTISKKKCNTEYEGLCGAENIECTDCGCVMAYVEEANRKVKILEII